MFIDVSFVPVGRVTHMLVDQNAPEELLKNLYKIRITPVLSAKVSSLPSSLSTHPDMQIFHCGGEEIICTPQCLPYYISLLEPLGFSVRAGGLSPAGNYPGDIAYNVTRVGNTAFHKKSCIDPQILRALERRGVGIIDVAQGYTKCAVAIVNENACITADKGVWKALDTAGIDTLLIQEGGISLEGFPFGFIGGTCGLLSPHLLAFCGNVERHRDYESIRTFARRHGVDLISLSSGDLVDIGSMIPIKQEVIAWNNSRS